MKLELATVTSGDRVSSIYVGTECGVYSVSLDWGHIHFRKGMKLSDLFENTAIMVSNFTEQNLMPLENFPGVMYFPCGTQSGGFYSSTRVSMVYLDTTNGEIKQHKHPLGVSEVYLSADEPFRGEICKIGESHSPFCNHTIALKIR